MDEDVLIADDLQGTCEAMIKKCADLQLKRLESLSTASSSFYFKASASSLQLNQFLFLLEFWMIGYASQTLGFRN